MMPRFRVVTWNCRSASRTSGLWDYLLELAPDVAILQDFRVVPEAVLQVYHHARNLRPLPNGRAPRHMTGVLVKDLEVADIELPAPVEWVARELENFREFCTGKFLTLHNGLRLKVLSVYSPAFPIERSRLSGIDTAGIKLTQNPDVWATELLWAVLQEMNISPDDPFIVAGDLNSSETFDYLWRGGPRGNRELMDRLNALHLYDCLRAFQGRLTPTFRTPRGGKVIHQLDHLYVTPRLLSKLVWRDVGAPERVFHAKPSLSDHLPIVADFLYDD